MDTSTKGPFRQAQDGMFSLREAVRRHFGSAHRLSRITYGYGVVFPHFSWDQSDPEYESWQIYDADCRHQPISLFIKQLSHQTHKVLERQPWYDSHTARPTPEDIEDLVKFLRGNFELIEKPGQHLAAEEREMLRLTEEQYRCLDALDNNARCLFEGGAGTGKTLLALEYARREHQKGLRVLVLCYNRLLGRWMTGETERLSADNQPLIATGTLHQVLGRIIASSQMSAEFAQLRSVKRSPEAQQSFFLKTYPDFALSAIREGAVEPYDVIVVDEGQDLIRPSYLDVLDALVRGGLSDGKWGVFCDFYRQALYADMSAEQMVGEIDQRVPRYTRYSLTVNCRNTKPIGEETALLSGFETPPFLQSGVEGVAVEYRFYETDEDQRRLLCHLIKDLVAQGFHPEQITILSAHSLSRSCLSKPLTDAGCAIHDLASHMQAPAGTVGAATIHAFKGLENSIIVLVDMDQIQDEKHRSLLYVGMSRARHRLYVFLSENARADYTAAIQRKLRIGMAQL